MAQHKKIILIGAGVLVAVVLVGGGFWLGHRHSKPTLNAATTANTAAPDSGSSLSVSGSSTADNLGQLMGGQNGQNGNGSTTSGSSSSSTVNPASFSQYDKYATNSTALFGDIQVGSGATLGANQKASITYKGWLTNGTLFDQSQTNSSGQLAPLNFTLGANQVIPGMEEGVTGMKVGGSRLIIVPPALGYGAQGQGSIPGNAVLVFQVQLVSVQ